MSKDFEQDFAGADESDVGPPRRGRAPTAANGAPRASTGEHWRKPGRSAGRANYKWLRSRDIAQ